MPQNRGKVSVAMTMVSSLQNGILYQSHSAAHRNEVGLLQVLTPDQALRFLRWFILNKKRCVRLFGSQQQQKQKQKSESSGMDGIENDNGGRSSSGASETGHLKASDSLNDICKQLTQAMMIAKSEESCFTSS